MCPDPIEPLLPPEGAPNVLILRLDDVAFGAASTFGGPCRTRVADTPAAGRPSSTVSTPRRCAHRPVRVCTQGPSSRFIGRISRVQVDLGDDDHDHFVDPQERLRIATSVH
jgi:hypothetical protein